jgi:hypothetical protein
MLSKPNRYCEPGKKFYVTKYSIIPPAIYEDSFFPVSMPTFVVGGVLDDSYSIKSEIKS